MRILPITNTDYRQKTNFGNKQTLVSGVIKNTMPNIGKTTAEIGGAVMVLAAITGAKATSDNTLDNFQIKDLTDDEYRRQTFNVINNKGKFQAFKWLDTTQINKWNVQLLNYMMQNPDEYDRPEYREMVKNLTSQLSFLWNSRNNKSRAEVALRMLKMPWFLKSHDYVRNNGVVSIARKANNETEKNCKLAMLDKLDEYKNTRIFSESQEYAIVQMLTYTSTESGLEVALKLLDNPDILDDQNPKARRGISENCFKIFSNDKESAKIKLALIDKINSKPELFETPYFKHATAGLLNNVIDKETLHFALKVLDNPKLFESQYFADNLEDILYHLPYASKIGDYKYKTERKIMYDILDAIEKRPELFKSEKFLDELGQLIFIRKEPYGGEMLSGKNSIEIGKKNLFLIENGYYY